MSAVGEGGVSVFLLCFPFPHSTVLLQESRSARSSLQAALETDLNELVDRKSTMIFELGRSVRKQLGKDLSANRGHMAAQQYWCEHALGRDMPSLIDTFATLQRGESMRRMHHVLSRAELGHSSVIDDEQWQHEVQLETEMFSEEVAFAFAVVEHRVQGLCCQDDESTFCTPCVLVGMRVCVIPLINLLVRHACPARRSNA